jgi:cytochrome c peroxidase
MILRVLARRGFGNRTSAAGVAGAAGVAAAAGIAAAARVSCLSPDIEGAKAAIAEVLESNEDMGPTLVRLAWHSSGTWDAASRTGGSNGATMRFASESSHGANAGLAAARDALEPVKAKFPTMSYSDLWILAGYTAIEEMGGPSIPFTSGRVDAVSEEVCPPEGRLPDAQKGVGSADSEGVCTSTAAHVREIFNRMGFGDREIVALLGAHALGRCHEEASGYWGPWTRAPTTFSNDYFVQLLENEWTLKNWSGPPQFETAEGDIMMLPSDMVLISDVDFIDTVIEYASDYDTFAADFAAAFKKLTEFGVVAPTDGTTLASAAEVESPLQQQGSSQDEVGGDDEEDDDQDEGEGEEAEDDQRGRTLSALLGREPSTAPVDPRFPNQNQNKYCYALYTKFQRCLRAHADDDDGASGPPCHTLKRWTHDMCPMEWVQQWDELMEQVSAWCISIYSAASAAAHTATSVQ